MDLKSQALSSRQVGSPCPFVVSDDGAPKRIEGNHTEHDHGNGVEDHSLPRLAEAPDQQDPKEKVGPDPQHSGDKQKAELVGAQKSHEKRHIGSHKTDEVQCHHREESRRARAQAIKEILRKPPPHLASGAVHATVSHLKSIRKQNLVAIGLGVTAEGNIIHDFSPHSLKTTKLCRRSTAHHHELSIGSDGARSPPHLDKPQGQPGRVGQHQEWKNQAFKEATDDLSGHSRNNLCAMGW
jgi:hypothetical protein